jgi:hypothetical protein
MFEPHINNDFLFGRVRIEGSYFAINTPRGSADLPAG